MGFSGFSRTRCTLAALALLGLSALPQNAQAQVYARDVETSIRLGNIASTTITFDDIFVPVSVLGANPDLVVTSLTLGIRRITGAPAVSATIWWAPMTGTVSSNIAVASGDVNSLGTQSLAANPGASFTELITLTNPLGLFTITPNQGISDFAGSGGFWIGLQMDSQSSNLNGWRATTAGAIGASSDNFYSYDIASSGTSSSGLSNFGNTTQASVYVIVSGVGSSSPEPGTLALLALGIAGGVIAKRWK